MSKSMIKRPSNPRDPEAWKAGNWPGAPAAKVKFPYQSEESLESISRTLAGKPTEDSDGSLFLGSLTWKDIARLNFATESPLEINYYLQTFNRCRRRTADGANFILDATDGEPWLWIPTAGAPVPVLVAKTTAPRICLAPTPTEFSKAILDIFDFVDEDGSGFLTKKDIRKALSRREVTGIHAAALVTLLADRLYPKLKEESSDEHAWESDISRADLRAFDARAAKNPTDSFVEDVNSYFAWIRAKLCNAEHELFVGRPNPYSVTQGLTGDCYLLAALVGLAKRDPGAIDGGASTQEAHTPADERRPLVRPEADTNGEGFLVAFPGDTRVRRISRPTDGEIAMLGSARGNGLWLTVLEKAWGEVTYGTSILDRLSSDTPLHAADSGHSTYRGIELVTGHEAERFLLSVNSKVNLRKVLKDALGRNKVITAGIRNGFLGGDREGWPMAHVYTVVGYDEAKDELEVRNPWGETRGVEFVPYAMKLDDFDRIFTDIAIEK